MIEILRGYYSKPKTSVFSLYNRRSHSRNPLDPHCMHCKEIPIYVFPEKELRGLRPNSYINMCVSDLYIPSMHAVSKVVRQPDSMQSAK